MTLLGPSEPQEPEPGPGPEPPAPAEPVAGPEPLAGPEPPTVGAAAFDPVTAGTDVEERALARLAGVRRRAAELRWRRGLGALSTAVAALGVSVLALVLAGGTHGSHLRVATGTGTTTTTVATGATTPVAATNKGGGVPVSAVSTLPASASTTNPGARGSKAPGAVPVAAAPATDASSPKAVPGQVAVGAAQAVSPTDWWVLGVTRSCNSASLCLYQTTDGGTSYSTLAGPPGVAFGGGTGAVAHLAVSADGAWLWGPHAVWTANVAGGAPKWSPVSLPGPVADLQAGSGDTAYALVTCAPGSSLCTPAVFQLGPGAAPTPVVAEPSGSAGPSSAAAPVALAAAGDGLWVAYADGSVYHWSGPAGAATAAANPIGSPCPPAAGASPSAGASAPVPEALAAATGAAPGGGSGGGTNAGSGSATAAVAALCPPAATSGGATSGGPTSRGATVRLWTGGSSWAADFSLAPPQNGPTAALAVTASGEVCAADVAGLVCQASPPGPGNAGGFASPGLVLATSHPQQVTGVSLVTSGGATAGLAVAADPSSPPSGALYRSANGLGFIAATFAPGG